MSNRTDTERLDWVTENASAFTLIDRDGTLVYHLSWGDDDFRARFTEAASWREAIDAAMRGEYVKCGDSRSENWAP